MPMLSNTTITTALAAVVSTPLQLRPAGGLISAGFTIQSNLTYGSGGTSGTVWVQTSLDEGLSWCDVANFAFTTVPLRQVLAIGNAAILAAVTPTDGSGAAGATTGIIGSLWRTKLTTVGTYAATTLRVDIDGIGFTSMT